jgi:hypothetical protein
MLAVVCYGIPKVGAEPSMEVRLWMWFIGWADLLGIIVPPADVPLVCGLVCAKLIVQEEDEGLIIVASSFLMSHSSINLCNSSSILFACLCNVELIID